MSRKMLAFVAEQNFNRSSEAIACDLIYQLNDYKIPEERITFGTPQVLDQRPEVSDDANTYVDVQIDTRFDTRFAGMNGFMYHRMPFSVLEPDGTLPIAPRQLPFKAWEILALINAQLHTQLTEKDIVNTTFTEGVGTLELKAAPGSLPWWGSVGIIVDINATGPRLATKTGLDGFVEYVAPPVPFVP